MLKYWLGVKMKNCKFLIVICFLTILEGCALKSDSNISNSIPSNSSRSTDVLFSFGQPKTSMGKNSKAAEQIPNEIVYLEDLGSNLPAKRKMLDEGENSVTFEKGTVNLLGFVYNPNLASQRGKSKDISIGIQSIGNLNIVKANLDSLPISEKANDEIDLGSLTISDHSVNSSVSSETILSALGYNGIDTYTMFDSSFLKFFNPDIDQNGKYDSEEGMKWLVSGLTLHSFYPDDFNESGPILPLATFMNGDFSLVIWLNSAFSHPDFKTVYLRLPPENIYIDQGGNPITSIYANWHGENGGPNGEFNQYYFNYFKSLIRSPKAPFNGDYELVLGGKTYYFSNLSFPKPTEALYEGFVFPQTTLFFDSNDYLKKASYRWWIIRNGQYEDPTEEELKLIVSQLIIVGKTPEDFGKVYYKNNDLDFSRFSVRKSDIIGTVSDAGTYRCDYWDRAGNSYNFGYHINGARPK